MPFFLRVYDKSPLFGWTYNALASLMFKDACLSHAKYMAALNPFESVKCVSDGTVYVTVFSRVGLFLDTFAKHFFLPR